MTALRQQGMTYGEIRQELGTPKSTLSDWLRKYPLSSAQIFQIQINRERRQFLARERTSITKRLKLEKRLKDCLEEQKEILLPLTEKELLLAGIFLYWGEGGKSHRGIVSISNTDPAVVKFSLLWMIHALNIPKEKIQVFLHLYSDMDVKDTFAYWSTTLNLPTTQFVKPYIKKSLRSDIDYKGYGHGTCMLRVSNTLLKEKILMSIKAMASYSDQYISEL